MICSDRAFCGRIGVSRSGIVDAIGVGDQGSRQGADLEQLVPVATRAGQPGHLDAEHQADPSEADLGDQALKPGPVRRAARATEILVDDEDALARPAELEGTVDQAVLQAGRL